MNNNYTLLYLEDDDLIRENFSEILRTFFKNVLSTDSGDEALKIYKENTIDIAILDANVNGLDGISVATKLREDKSEDELIILMISAYSDREKLLRSINLQLFAYLVKPIRSKELFDVLHNVIRTLNQRTFSKLSGEFRWDTSRQILLHKDKELQITKNEQLAVDVLVTNKNSYMSACDIQEKIFKEKSSEENNCNNIVQLLSRLKKKIEALHLPSEYFIENCYGIGYKITTY